MHLAIPPSYTVAIPILVAKFENIKSPTSHYHIQCKPDNISLMVSFKIFYFQYIRTTFRQRISRREDWIWVRHMYLSQQWHNVPFKCVFRKWWPIQIALYECSINGGALKIRRSNELSICFLHVRYSGNTVLALDNDPSNVALLP